MVELKNELNMFRKVVVISLFCFLSACSSKSVQKDDERFGPVEERLSDGTLLLKFDVNQDGSPDVWKYFLEESSKEDATVLTRRLLKKEVDVNYDGTKNVIRTYTEEQTLKEEEVDVDLNGKIDIINYFDNGILAKKDLFDEAEKKVTTRFYDDRNQVVRVEKDTNGDSSIDYWEYYEAGVLDRIGRDLDGDGRADTWQTR